MNYDFKLYFVFHKSYFAIRKSYFVFHHSYFVLRKSYFVNLKIISAGAGSGKTYRLTNEMVHLLKQGVRPDGIIATTFTSKAAAELMERVRVKLLHENMPEAAESLPEALIGTVHGLGTRLLKRFAFEVGVSPEVEVIAEEDARLLFNQSLSSILKPSRIGKILHLSTKLGLTKGKTNFDWRDEVRKITEVAQANAFSKETLEESKRLSIASFSALLPKISLNSADFFAEQLKYELDACIERLSENEDSTKKKESVLSNLKAMRNELNLRGYLAWHQWAKISKEDISKKSAKDFEALQIFVLQHNTHPDFHKDINDFISNIFDISIEAIHQYDQYKKKRGLIDYTDMEVKVKLLLENERVRETIRAEFDLLLVDEFQDTSPIQLDIFLKLAKLVKYTIWVGDPKQSIYGFRGAEPRLMQAIIEQTGGIKTEDILECSWRSREDIVLMSNVLFTKAFTNLPPEQIILHPKRLKTCDAPEMTDALIHWHFNLDSEKGRITNDWFNASIAEGIRQLLERGISILPKGEKKHRLARAGDIAVLCRSNYECANMAKSLHAAGLQAAIARNGLLHTAEAKLVLACLKFLLNKYDTLSIAEILLLADAQKIEQIVEDRLEYLERLETETPDVRWAEKNPFILKINELRPQVVELSSTELLDLLLEELDLRRIVARWGSSEQRLANTDMLRRFAAEYENACNRLHSAASLGGYLLWLNDIALAQNDKQASGENPDAVNVMTYHKSKGLEYPITICHALDNDLKETLFGVNIVAESEKVDLDNVLQNRWLRYWVNPYADQIARTELSRSIDDSPARAEARRHSLAEEARLLYVGITRARDYLILPTNNKGTSWLNRVWNEGNGELPTLDVDTHESPWVWNGQILQKYTEKFYFGKDLGEQENLAPPDIRYFEARSGRAKHPAANINLSEEHANSQAVINNPFQYASPIHIPKKVNTAQAIRAAHIFMAADSLELEVAERNHIATRILERLGIKNDWNIASIVQNSNALLTHFQLVLGGSAAVHQHYPLRGQHKKRNFEATIDFIFETPTSIIFIQNHSEVIEMKKMKTKAADLATFLHVAAKKLGDGKAVRKFVHFALMGAVVEVG
jgi:ATP-dependent helicase/nuclease subunit A